MNLSNFTTCRISELQPSSHKTALTAGIITNIRTRQTKRGDRIAIFSLDDGSNTIEVVCFSECYQKYRSLLTEDQMVIVDGEVGIDDFSNSARILGRDIYTLDQARERFAKHVRINIRETLNFDMQHLRQLLNRHLGGTCPIVIRFSRKDVQADIRLGSRWQVKPSEEFVTIIKEQLPAENIEIIYE